MNPLWALFWLGQAWLGQVGWASPEGTPELKSAMRARPTPAGELQAIRELEWQRAEPVALAAFLPGEASQRAAVAVALGRLRSEEALSLLAELRMDADSGVQLQAARALAFVPGAGPTIREWLALEPMPVTLSERAEAEEGVVVALVEGLGFFGDEADVAALLVAAREPWPVGAAAARALGRLGTRKVATVKQAIPVLASRLSVNDPRLVADVAWALARIGMDDAGPTDLEAVLKRLRGASYERTRAWLVRAAWRGFEPSTRAALFVELATDSSRLVRVTLFTAIIGAEDTEADVLAPWLVDADPWIRLTVIEALGRIGGDVAHDALRRHGGLTSDPYERAATVRALGAAAVPDESAPPIVRAAQIEVSTDVAAVATAAMSDPEALVRSAAAGVLLDREDLDDGVGEQLFSASDPAVREAAIGLLERTEPANQVRVLVERLALEESVEVLLAGLSALEAALASAPVKKPEVVLGPLVTALGKHPSPAVRRALAPVASLAGRELDPARQPGSGPRDLVLPTGAVVKVATGRPALGEVGRVRGAVVETTEGTFVLSLDPDTAPLAVWNFALLAEAGFYDDGVFHRVIPGFVAQTGCPRGDGWGGPGYTLPDEVSSLPFAEGALGMARAARDTGGSQWFVTTADQPHLVGEYTRFGQVVDGIHVVKRLHPGSRVVRVVIERIPAGP